MDDRSEARPLARRQVRPLVVAMMAASIATTGCQGMATTTQDAGAESASRPDNTVADWPLKFVQHSFGGLCYSTYGCTIDYNGYRHRSDPDDQLRPALASVHPDILRNASAGYLGILGFPPPALVRWRSTDGSAHEAKVDIGAIFADGLLLHETPRDDIPEGVSIGNPAILLVVDDRTISVYMRAFVPTRSLRTPGNPHSNFRKDPVLAWSRTY